MSGALAWSRPTRHVRATTIVALATSLLGIIALAVRSAQSHAGLLYPDGYQYLLIARGLADHLGPTTRLGPAGDLFVPSVDAAAKPLYPALIALADRMGADPLVAARTITTIAAAAVVVLVGLLVLRLSASPVAATFAAAACLFSPALGFWSGFAGVDPLAQALALGASLACAMRRPGLAGALAGLAVATRPELAVVALGGCLVCLASTRLRADATRAAAFGTLTAGAVFVTVHPALALPSSPFVLGGIVGVAAVAAGFAAVSLTRWAAPAAATLTALLVVTHPAGTTLARSEGAMLLIALAGAVLVRWEGSERIAVGAGTVSAATLTAIYTLKNPSSDRYLTLLIPVVAVVAGLTVGRLAHGRRRSVLVALLGAFVVAGTVIAPPRPAVGPDAFALLASELTDRPTLPLLTVAPDAYGWLLPGRSVRELRPGERGLILLDGAQRLYAPELSARGTEVAWFDGAAFARPDSTVDTRKIRLIDGIVVRRAGRP